MPRTTGNYNARTRQLMWAAVEILEAIQPASVRAVAYQLFNRKLIPDMSKGSTNRVSSLLKKGREDGVIPWAWVVDGTRGLEGHPSWNDVDAFLESVFAQYRRDYWEMQATHLEVWSEKATVAGSLLPVLNRYGVGFRALHGYNSTTKIHEAAQASAEADKRWVVLYVGDWDPSGMDMSERDLPQRIDRYGGMIALERIALGSWDLAGLAPWAFAAENKRGDARYPWFVARYGATCYELDAMNPNDLRARVDEAIQGYIEPGAWERCQATEAAEEDSLKEVLTRWTRDRARPTE